MKIYHLDENDSFTLFTFFFFLSKSSTALFSFCIPRTKSFLGFSKKSYAKRQKYPYHICFIGFDICGSSSTWPNTRMVHFPHVHFFLFSSILLHREEIGALATFPKAMINISSIAIPPKFMGRAGNTRVNIACCCFLPLF